jgi:diaminopimelate decarboxylase
MEIRLAVPEETDRVRKFFAMHLSQENAALYSEEFFCPLGVGAAIRHDQLIVALDGGAIVGAARFYRRKQIRQISLYQFAIAASHRGRGLLLRMLEMLRDTDIVVLCPSESTFNRYFCSTGWTLSGCRGRFNQWCLPKR